MVFIYFLYIIFGILPSLAWLFYYLKKDLHPESKKMILKIFLLGSLTTIPVYIIQKQLIEILGIINLPSIFIYLIYWFLIIAFTEELFKYLEGHGYEIQQLGHNNLARHLKRGQK